MVKFIKQEADEKANEIAVSAEEVGRAGKLLLHTSVCGALYGRHTRAALNSVTPEGCMPGIRHS